MHICLLKASKWGRFLGFNFLGTHCTRVIQKVLPPPSDLWAIHMTFVTFVAARFTCTFMVHPFGSHFYFYSYTVQPDLWFGHWKRENAPKINVLIVIVSLIPYETWIDVFSVFKTKISQIFVNSVLVWKHWKYIWPLLPSK